MAKIRKRKITVYQRYKTAANVYYFKLNQRRGLVIGMLLNLVPSYPGFVVGKTPKDVRAIKLLDLSSVAVTHPGPPKRSPGSTMNNVESAFCTVIGFMVRSAIPSLILASRDIAPVKPTEQVNSMVGRLQDPDEHSFRSMFLNDSEPAVAYYGGGIDVDGETITIWLN